MLEVGGKPDVSTTDKTTRTINNTRKDIHMTDTLLNIKQVRDRLGLSYEQVIELVKHGRLRAYRYAGTGPVMRTAIRYDTKGLRFRESDIEQMLEASLVQ
jgi:hypothetical protein